MEKKEKKLKQTFRLRNAEEPCVPAIFSDFRSVSFCGQVLLFCMKTLFLLRRRPKI